MPLWKLYTDWVARHVPTGHCIACCVRETTCHEEECPEHAFCGERCQQHFHALQRVPQLIPMALGVKRLLELTAENLDRWQQLPDEILVAIIELSYPEYGTDAVQFTELQSLRYVNERVKRLVDQWINPRLQALPRTIEERLHGNRLNQFPSLVRLNLFSVNRESIDTQQLREARLPLLESLSMGHRFSTNGVRLTDMPPLPRLRVLDLSNPLDRDEDLMLVAATLEQLTLSYNRKIYGSTLHQMPRLRALMIHTHDDTFFPDHLSTLTGLETLRLETLRFLSSTVLQPLTALTQLSLSLWSRVADDFTAQLAQLTRLTSLSLGMAYNGDGPGIVQSATMAALTQLQSVELDTSVQLEDNDDLATLPLLTQLTMGDQTEFFNPHLRALTGLTHLHLKGRMEVSYDIMVELAKLVSLRLGHGETPYVGLATLYSMTQLHALHLGDATWSITPERMGPLVLLRDLWIRSDPENRNHPALDELILPPGCRVHNVHDQKMHTIGANGRIFDDHEEEL